MNKRMVTLFYCFLLSMFLSVFGNFWFGFAFLSPEAVLLLTFMTAWSADKHE